jgi:hypothetical protein
MLRLRGGELIDEGNEEDVPRATALKFSSDGRRVAYMSDSAAGSIVVDISKFLRFPPLVPPRFETLGERLEAEHALRKEKVRGIGAGNDSLFVMDDERIVRVDAPGAEPAASFPIKKIQHCFPLSDGGFITGSRSDKVQRWDANGTEVWATRPKGKPMATNANESLLLITSAGGTLVAAKTGEIVAGMETIGTCTAAAISGDTLYFAGNGDVVTYSLSGL